MKIYVAVTDDAWFRHLHGLDPRPEEVNFWKPGGHQVKHLVGTPWLFKLHAPNNYIVGGGYFTYFTQMPLHIAWESFEQKNGVASVTDLQRAIGKYREGATLATPIGCVVLSEPFFLDPDRWIPIPENWSPNIVTGKSYDTEEPAGTQLWQAVIMNRLHPITPLVQAEAGYGKPQVIKPRLGQGYFRLRVTDAYDRCCAVTGERALPALEAAHIVPFADIQTHDVRNGLLLRADIHRLFDQGYVTVNSDYRFLVSGSIHAEFHNGADYYKMHGQTITLPADKSALPDRGFLEKHRKTTFHE